MDEQQHHEELVKGITEQMKPVLEKSQQAIYLYLDDNHKVCNKKFADLLGYKSPKEWADAEAPLSDVVEEDQQSVINAYMNASEKMVASTIEVRVKNIKTGKIVKTRMIIAPIGHAGHVFTAHFFSRI
jgi:hemolysin-activating ACP:hemolysin acyltransferase